MQRIGGSVGQNGDNIALDVRLVQQLLNRHDLAPLERLGETGAINPATITAIRHFQARFVGMGSPDGRVDPDGKTLKYLGRGTSGRGTGANVETRKADNELRTKFVDPRVRETGATSRIIDALIPNFANFRAKIISGFLSDSDLFWKVNYHWEYLLEMVRHSLDLPIDENSRSGLENIRSNLMSVKPDPQSGYITGALGKPEDKSSILDVNKRHKLLTTSKQSFKKIVDFAGLKQKSKKSNQAFDLAAAPVAHPGSSKHSTGYALDIQGDNSAIKASCKSLGATLIFDEKSHVHVEFKNGIRSS